MNKKWSLLFPWSYKNIEPKQGGTRFWYSIHNQQAKLLLKQYETLLIAKRPFEVNITQ